MYIIQFTTNPLAFTLVLYAFALAFLCVVLGEAYQAYRMRRFLDIANLPNEELTRLFPTRADRARLALAKGGAR